MALELSQRVIEVLLTTALDDVSGVTFLPRGDPQPGSGSIAAWCQIVACEVTDRQRTRYSGSSTEPDLADVVLTVNVFVDEAATRADAYALASAVDAVAAEYKDETFFDASSKTRVDVTHVKKIEDPAPDEQRGYASGAVLVTALAVKTA